jgi:hypothetical protein
MKRPLILLGCLALLLAVGSADAASRAVIVVGLTGAAENTEDFQRLAAATKQLLITRGFSAGQVEVLDANVTRDLVLQKLKPAAGDAATDEFWLVLFGYSGMSQGGVPAFQVSGPRLTADDLKTALDAIPSREFVMIGTNSSGAFLPILQSPRRTVVSATKEEGQTDQPRFPDKWVDAFTENPKATFTWIAARAAALVDDEYTNSGLAQTETSRLADPVSGNILEPPFGENLAAPAETPAPQSEPATNGGSVDDININVKLRNPNAEWEHQAATDETRKIIADARAVPNPDGQSAIILDQQIKYTVNEDRTTDEVHFTRVYLARDEAVEQWANYFLPQSPPAVTTKLQVARVIRPDGSSLVFNPAKLAGGADSDSGTAPGSAQVFLPDAGAGCVVEIGYQTLELLDATLPEVSEAMPIQREVPVLKTELEARVPGKQHFHVVLKNDAAPPAESDENGLHVYRWALGEIPAADALPGDAPAQEWMVWLGISSLPDWNVFTAWYDRIAQGSDVIDAPVKAEAADLAQGVNTRMEKIRRAFEFVSSLRYIAIELGVQGFRPRTPAEVLNNRYGDCKDKANLLVALLRCMGVDARFVLLDRGGSTDITFPSWQFNHAICFVPKAPDAGQSTDIWLDSTDSITPFGFIAPGDYGREALVFGPDKAEFKKIAGTGADVSRVDDVWDLAEDSGGVWSGTFRRRAAGLADYALREAFRGLSPGQRREQIYEQLDGLWPAGDLTGATVSDASQLRQGMEIDARAINGARSLPLPDFPWLKAFSSPQRDRPLLLNDGQQFAGTQTVRLRFSKAAPESLPEPVEIDQAGQTFRITWRKLDPNTVERVAEIAFKNPRVESANYAGLRRAVRDWTEAVTKGEL